VKKLILATAAAALVPCAASAMTVTLYGVADANISYFRNSENSITSMNSGGLGGSRWGLRGVEKLSETLDAIFVLESGFNINTGTSAQGGRLFGRQAYTGLRSKDFGQIIMGRLQGLGYEFSGKYDPMVLAPGSVIGSLTGENPTPWMYNPLSDPARMDNAIQYRTPKFAGFEFAYQHGFRSSPTAANRSKSFDLAALNYSNGPLNVTYAFGRSLGTTYTNSYTGRQTEHALGVSYKFEWATVFATYQLRKSAGYDGTDRAWQLGARVPVSKSGHVHFAYGQANNDVPFVPRGATAEVRDWDVRSWAVGYVHNLSKRTMLYTYFKQLDNRNNARQTIFPPGGLPGPSTNGERVSAFGVGMQHRF